MPAEAPRRHTPIEVATYYGFPKQHTGRGQSIAIISLGGLMSVDELKKDFAALGINVDGLSVVSVHPDAIIPEQDALPTHETHLDVEVVGSICPDAKITIYRGPNPYGMAEAVERAISDGNTVISISWGGPEPLKGADPAMDTVLKDMETVLESAKEKGVTVCAAAGDGGSADLRSATGEAIPAPDGKVHVDFPASSPLVLACGGTALKDGDKGRGEVVWNQASTGGGAAGGGVSEIFDIPPWQASAEVEIPSASSGRVGRIVPDVAGLATDRTWTFYEAGKAQLIGGTSAVAPLWASFIALANEARADNGKGTLGFLNDRLYRLAAGGGLFNDITSGTNRCQPDYPGYDATTGFDACTGWGTPIGPELFAALVDLD
jgi:kumamolisin